MNKFSLSSFHGLPAAVEENGRKYAINTDYRVILRIFRMLSDPEVPNEDKPWLLRKMFFAGAIPREADKYFSWFVGMGREEMPGSGKRDFDYEQDAVEIYSAFLQTYGVDLLETDLHWWKFLPMLEGVFSGDNALSNKIRIRHVDDGENERKNALGRQKMAVALTEAVGRREANINELLMERLQKGQPIGDLLRR